MLGVLRAEMDATAPQQRAQAVCVRCVCVFVGGLVCQGTSGIGDNNLFSRRVRETGVLAGDPPPSLQRGGDERAYLAPTLKPPPNNRGEPGEAKSRGK